MNEQDVKAVIGDLYLKLVQANSELAKVRQEKQVLVDKIESGKTDEPETTVP